MASSVRRTRAADRAAGLATIPAAALRFDAGPFAFAAGQAKDGNRPISMLARTAKPIEHWYWGKVVHDMAGMQLAAPTLPIDYCHDPEEILGYLDQFDAGPEGLTVSGQVVSFQADDRAAEICHKADAGVPYQSSIAFDSGSVVCEDVREGMQVTVNGYQLQGPALIIRQWKLRAVSVCPYGADSDTRTSLAAADRDIAVQFISQNQDPAHMSKPQNYADPESVAEAAKLAAPAPSLQSAAPAPAAPAADPRAEFKATLGKFTAAFGPANGAAWAAEGLTYEQALEKHAAELSASNKKLTDEKAQLETKLAAVPRGEAAPVSFATNDKHEGGPAKPTGKFAGLGKLAAFAENLRLPTTAK